MANYISKYSGAQIDLSVASGSSVTGIIRDFNTLSGSSTSTLTIGGDANIGGVIYADQFVSSSGDLILDGNVSASGYISTQGNITASGTLTANSITNVNTTHITASGTISASGIVVSSLTAGQNLDIGSHGFRALQLQDDSLTIDGGIVFSGVAGILEEDSNLTFSGDTLSATQISSTNITASGNISASGTSHSFGANVGIGTASPVFTSGTGLMISDSTQANLRLADGTDYIDIANSAGDLYIINRKSDGRIRFRVNNTTEAIRIVEDGSVGIGSGFSNTVDPKNGLHITGSDGTTSGIRQSRAGVRIWNSEIDSNGRLSWGHRSTEGGSRNQTFTLDDTGFVGIGTGAPSFPLDVESSEDILATFVSTDNKAVVQVRDDDTIGYISTENNVLSIGGNIGANVNNLNIITSSGNVGIGTGYPTKKLQVEGDISASGNLKIQGGLTVVGAITSSIVSSSIVFSSGSNIFGDADTDQHTFNGSISASSNLRVTGDISASGDLIFKEDSGIKFSNSDTTHISMSGNDLFIRSDDDMIFKADDDFTFRGGSSHTIGLHIDGDNQRVGIGGTSTPTEALQVTGDISGSADLHLGAHGSIRNLSGNLTIRPEGDLKLGTDSTDNVLIGRLDAGMTTIFTKNGLNVTGSGAHITASGNISASVTSTGSFGFGHFDGRVGIGTTSPDTQLHILGPDELTLKLDATSGQPAILFAENDTNRFEMRGGDDDFGIYDMGTSKWEFRIKAGNVGIGTHNDNISNKLQVAGNISSSGALMVGQSPAGQHISASNNEIEIIGNHPSHDNKIKFTNSHATIGGYQMGLNGGTKSFLISSGSTSAEFDTPIFQVSGSLARNVVSVNPGGSNGSTSITASLEVSGAFSDIRFNNLPTSDPGVAGQLWSNSGVLTVSSG